PLPPAGPRCKVDDCIQAGSCNAFKRFGIANIEVMKLKAIALKQSLQPPLLKPRVISVVQIINCHHGMTIVEQHLGYSRTNEPRGAGHQILQSQLPSITTSSQRLLQEHNSRPMSILE